MTKRILLINDCPRRAGGPGLAASKVAFFNDLDDPKCQTDLLDTSFFMAHHAEDYQAHEYFAMPSSLWIKYLLKVPHINRVVIEKVVCREFKRLMSKKEYDLVFLYQIPFYSSKIVDIAHKFKTRVLLQPWGSDVLRAEGRDKENVRKTYHSADFLGGNLENNIFVRARDEFGVPESKMIDLKAAMKGVAVADEFKGKYSRGEMSEMLGIPYSPYNIICGYNTYSGQRHKLIISECLSIKESLPEGYQLVFPVTYGGNGKEYVEELKQLCSEGHLNAVFLEKFMTPEQIAYLHLVTDLYINIQPTDTGNAFLIEAISCGNQIVTGSWLGYEQFKQFGNPFYLCDKQEDLGQLLKMIFTKAVDPIYPPDALVKSWVDNSKIPSSVRWQKFLKTI